jgi:ElaB/YqjD/DUF883 family membrane-anchored ribosome-binding protein
MSEINETLKNIIDELDLDRRVNEFVGQTETLLKRAVETAADFAHEHRDDVDRALDRITAQIEDRTDGRYADQVGKVRGQVEIGLTRLAERRPEDPA